MAASDPVEEPSSEASALRRLARLAPALPVRLAAAPQFVVSYSNDAWDLGELFLRVGWRDGRERLTREAVIGAALPEAVGFPELLGAGAYEDLTWTLSRRMQGVTLGAMWLDADRGRLRAVVAHLAERLRALHAWTPTGEAAAMLAAHAADRPEAAEAIVGSQVIPLPMERSAALIGALKAQPYVDPGVVDAAWDRMQSLARFDPAAAPTDRVAHLDATSGNILVDGDRVSALIDFEWARLGPAIMEAPAWTRELEDLRREGANPPPMIDWMAEAYPAMFAAPHFTEQLWLCELAYTLRHILAWPPNAPVATLVANHPLHRLRRLIDAPIPWR